MTQIQDIADISPGGFASPGFSDEALTGVGAVSAFALEVIEELNSDGIASATNGTLTQRGSGHLDIAGSTGVALEQWFERFHVIAEALPLSEFSNDLALGNVLSFQERPGKLWNAFAKRTVTVTAVNVNVDGVTLTGITVPEVVAPLSDKDFLISVDTVGSPTISGTIEFVTDAGTIVIDVTGRRVIELPLLPQPPLTETLRFSTDIIRSRNGSEKRQAQRAAPEQIMEFTVLERDENMSELNNILFDWMPRLFGVPMKHEERATVAEVLAGATSIAIDTAYADYRAGGLGQISTYDGSSREIFEIREVLAGSLELEIPLVSGYPAGALVSPARLGFGQNRIPQRLFAIEAGEMTLQFTIIDNEPIEVVPFDTEFGGIPVFDDPNFISRIRYSRVLANDFTRTTYGKLPRHEERSDRATMTTPKTWRVESREDLWKIRSWLHQLKGSQGVFYLPTFRRDFELVAPIGAGAVTIDVTNRGFSTYVGSREPFSAVQIELRDGTVYRRDLSSSQIVDESVERVGIGTALGQEVSVADVRRISLLQLCRMADDRASIVHEAPGVATISISATAVRA